MTGPVIAGRDGSVRHIRCANKADFTVICIVGGFRNLFRLFFALSRRIGYGTLGRIGIAVAIPSSTSPAASAPITPKRADVRIPLRLSLPLLVRTSSSASTTTTVMALRSGGSLGRLGVGHWGGGDWSESGRVSQATRSKEDGTNSVQGKGVAGDRLIEPKSLLSRVFTRCDDSLFVVASMVEGRFSFQGGGQAARE